MELVKPGSRNDAVRELQKQLNKLGYNLDEDGIFGSGCQAAVKDFQQKSQLGPDGVVGNNTWEALDAALKKQPEQKSSITPLESRTIEGDALISKSNLEEILSDLSGDTVDKFFIPLNDGLAKFKINTPLRIAHFISQLAHESNGFKAKEENLNYSAKRLREVFHKYFKTDEEAEKYARNREMIANRVYADRMDNGDEASGDGYKYRGRGLIQLTGRYNYTKCSKAIGIDIVSNPDLIIQNPKVSAMAAAWYWDFRNINKKADANDVQGVTYLVNGGDHGSKQRETYLEKAKKVLGIA